MKQGVNKGILEKLLIDQVTVLDPRSSWNGKKVSLLVDKGVIKKIAPLSKNLDLPEDVFSERNIRRISREGMFILPSFFDLSANAGEPGFELGEDLETANGAALMGGFGGLAIMPNTEPVLQSKSEIELILSRSRDLAVKMIPVGAVSKNRAGREMADLYDMWLSGAKAFSDGDRPVQNSGLMMRTLQYVSDFGGLVIARAEDEVLGAGAGMHEGKMSLRLGMKGIPSIAEELMISRDLMIARYTGAKIHFGALSSAGSTELIRRAKHDGVNVTCSTSAHQLTLDESCLVNFDSNFKVKPPFRSKADRQALISAVLDGTIDAICSDHTPKTYEEKHVEFETAAFGIIALETCYSLVNAALSDKEVIIERLCHRPREILGLPVQCIEESQIASFTLTFPKHKYVLEKTDLGSRSSNTPFLSTELTGKVAACYASGRLFENW